MDQSKEELINNIIKDCRLDTNLISDGYHTFKELYDHRIALYIALCKQLSKYKEYRVWKSINHSDGTHLDGWFIMGIVKNGKQISYHLPISDWNKTNFAELLEFGLEWDRHTSNDVLQRLNEII